MADAAYYRRYRKLHPGLDKRVRRGRAYKYKATTVRAKAMRRHTARLRRLPAWADRAAIAAIYAGVPEGYHVDHVLPLRGRTVSGLHVPENLQYLPAAENFRKGNRV